MLMVTGLVTPVMVVPVPWVKPAGPYSIFQLFSLPPGVLDKVMYVLFEAVEVRFWGFIQVGITSKTTSSIYTE